MKTRDLSFIFLGLIAFCITATPVAEPADDEVERIKEEALTRSLVMDHAFYLTEVTGPRLTGSPAFTSAAAWVKNRLTEYGLEHVRLERFPWPSTWTYSRVYAALVEPGFSPLIVTPMPWSPSTAGRVVAEATLAPYAHLDHPTEQGFTEFFRKAAGTLRGKIVLLQEPVVPPLTDRAFARRLSDAELDRLGAPLPAAPTSSSRPPQDFTRLNNLLVETFDFVRREGAKAVLWRASGEGGTVFATVLSTAFRQRRGGAPLPIFFVAAEHYNRLARLLPSIIFPSGSNWSCRRGRDPATASMYSARSEDARSRASRYRRGAPRFVGRWNRRYGQRRGLRHCHRGGTDSQDAAPSD